MRGLRLSPLVSAAQTITNVTSWLGFSRGISPETYGEAPVWVTPQWDDLRIVPGAFDFAGNNDPALVNYQPGGSGATFKVYAFDQNDEVFFACQFPHSYKPGSDIKAHVHWTPGANGTAEAGRTVYWALDYSWANINEVFTPSSSIAMPDVCDGTNHKHQMTSGVTIAGDGKSLSSQVLCRLYRLATDTWNGTAANAPIFIEFDFHFIKDTLGSREEAIK